MQRLPNPRLITDGMSGGGQAAERYSWPGAGSPAIDQPSTIAPLSEISDLDHAAAVIPLNYPPNRYRGQSEMPTAERQTGPWTDPGFMAEGSRDQAGFKQT